MENNLDKQIADLARSYFEAKDKTRKLKQKRADLHSDGEGGSYDCSGVDTLDSIGPCYESQLRFEEWCSFCKKRQPIHVEYQASLNTQRSKLLALRGLCKKTNNPFL